MKEESVKILQSALSEVYTPMDKGGYLLRSGQRISNLFSASAFLKKDAKAMAIADCLSETYKPENIYVSRNIVNYQTGEVFDGYGVLQSGVASRLSPAYQKFASSRARKRAEARISRYKQLVWQEWRFATFTIPFLKADVGVVLGIVSRAMELLKKRRVFCSNVDGAFCGEELTIGDGSTAHFTHFHSHIHVLMLGRYIEQRKLADEWTDCVEKACREFGVDFSIPNLKTNRLIVDIRSVKKYAKKRSITMGNSLLEVCKYVVKGSDFEKVPVKQLVEIETALRGRQMVKAYGVFNNHKGRAEGVTLDKDTSLDTLHTIDGEAFKPKFKRTERKLKSLVELGEEMISGGKREAWLKILYLTMQSRREFRQKQLAMKYPRATFRTLDGRTWNGVSVSSANH
jgi:protein gp37